MEKLLLEIKNCTVCKEFLPYFPNPVVRANQNAKILIIGQAPGLKVQNTGIPWNDASGDNLRKWLGLDRRTFYDETKIALVPMGFCFPGTGKNGDLPPRPECAPLWHQKLIEYMPNICLTLLIGQYAQKYYLKQKAKATLTTTVKNFEDYLPHYLPLPHPSPRNNIWQRKNPWFNEEIIPVIKQKVQELISIQA